MDKARLNVTFTTLWTNGREDTFTSLREVSHTPWLPSLRMQFCHRTMLSSMVSWWHGTHVQSLFDQSWRHGSPSPLLAWMGRRETHDIAGPVGDGAGGALTGGAGAGGRPRRRADLCRRITKGCVRYQNSSATLVGDFHCYKCSRLSRSPSRFDLGQMTHKMICKFDHLEYKAMYRIKV